VLLVVIFASGTAGVVAARTLTGSFLATTTRVGNDAAVTVDLRTSIVKEAALVHVRMDLGDGADTSGLPALEAVVDDRFRVAIENAEGSAARPILVQARETWTASLAAAVPLSADIPVTDRQAAHQVFAGATDGVSALLDASLTARQPEIRSDLAHAAGLEREILLTMVAAGAIVFLMVLHLARRLSSEVLRPVGLLRDSADELAAGRFDHRVIVDSDDELGELASRFNAMAETFAGNQRTLTLEASTDSLSGLANRSAFHTRLSSTLAGPDRRAGGQAVLFVDLDDFKDVNDSLGHAAGDDLLRIVADRLREAVRPSDLVARLGGDEFALLLDGLTGPDMAVTAAERVVRALAAPVVLGEHEAHVGASVGLAMRQVGSTVEGLMREADVAMYAAKAKGKNRVERYDPTLDELAVARRLRRIDIRRATDLVAPSAERSD
jgi:diguanylate cyclase (GGDEF)-like protein